LGDCTGDFMRTNQWVNPAGGFNTDGGTVFWFACNGAQATAVIIEGWGVDQYDGGYGLKRFYESRGYTVDTMYNQYILGYKSPTQGFTYDQYKAEINAGRPVMIHLEGHTVVGVGYGDTTTDLMYIHDTWDYTDHSMTWGGTYSGMQHQGVTIVQLQSLPPVITSCTLAGDEMNQFARGESVYVKGSGLEPNTVYNIWIQNAPVDEGKTLVTGEDPSGAQETVTTGPDNGNPSGGFPVTEIWAILESEPVTHHPYDIVVDKQSDGVNTDNFNSGSDGIDSVTAVGFVAPVHELPAILLFSLGLLVLMGYVVVRQAKKEE
jgi:hypothetical protein